MQQLKISFSEYRLFRSCAFKHFLQRNLSYYEPGNEYLQFGSALHSAIEDVINTNPKKFQYGNMVAAKLAEEGMSDVYLGTFMGKALVNEGTEILKKLDFHERYKGWEVVGVEREVNHKLFEYNGYEIFFKGIIDLILKKDDQYLILDWKSAQVPWDIEKKKQDMGFFGQLALYKTFFAAAENIPLENIATRFVALSRKPITIQQFGIDISKEFRSNTYEDFCAAIKEVIDINPNHIPKAKFVDKAGCQYCKLHKVFCNDEEIQLIPHELPEILKTIK